MTVERKSTYCECGRKKSDSSVEACNDCRYLDGARCGARDVIAAFRTVGPRLSVPDLVTLTGLNYDNCSNILRRLVQGRRARRVVAESYVFDRGTGRTDVKATAQTYYELITALPRVTRAAERSRRRKSKRTVRAGASQ
jgi:hypothetical protein